MLFVIFKILKCKSNSVWFGSNHLPCKFDHIRTLYDRGVAGFQPSTILLATSLDIA